VSDFFLFFFAMKFVVGLALLALAVCASAYTYIFPQAPCAFGLDMKKNGTKEFRHYRYYVYGNYYKKEVYNYKEQLIQAEVLRPDITRHGKFTFSGLGCDVNYDSASFSGKNYRDMIADFIPSIAAATEYYYIDDAVYNGQKCMVYFKANPDTHRPDKNYEAVFVNYAGQLIGFQSLLDDPEERYCVNVTYFTTVPMSVFQLSKSYCYDAADERIFSAPSSYFAHCSASTNSIVFSTVFAFLLAVLALVF